MTNTERHILDTYAGLFESLNSITKLELIERLAKSIRNDKEDKENNFFSSFGAFASEKSAEEIIKEIRGNRTFKKEDIEL